MSNLTNQIDQIDDDKKASAELFTWIREISRTETSPIIYRVAGRMSLSDRWRESVDVRTLSTDDGERVFGKLQKEIEKNPARYIQVQARLRGQKVPFATFAVENEIEPDPETESDISDKSGAASIVKQALTHNEFLLNAVMKMAASQTQALQAMVSRYEQREASVETQRQAILAAQQEIALDTRASAAEEKKWSIAASAVEAITTSVAYKITQGIGKPDTKTKVVVTAIQKLFGSITQEQGDKIASVLDANQLTLLGTILEDPDGLVRKAELATQKVTSA